MDLAPYTMRIRRQIVEHPFGTIKSLDGLTHFLMKRLKNVKNRDQPPRPGLQHEAGDRDPRRRAADGAAMRT